MPERATSYELALRLARGRAAREVDAALRGAFEQRRVSAEDARDPAIGGRGSPGWYALEVRLFSEVTGSIRFAAAVENLLDRPYRPHGAELLRNRAEALTRSDRAAHNPGKFRNFALLGWTP